ncbi:DUF4231 domain-containing protein [Ureibacillus thermosphaericus]|nr:DUF4231 domain-containing protein [Ureibacillus thermosphaericus]
MDESKYIKERLDEQINWYDTKSIKNQKIYKLLKTFQIISAALIPFLASLVADFKYFIYVVSFLGVLVSILEGILSLGKYHENWIEYRSICETLKREKYMFLGKAGVYSENSSLEVLVERIETIISNENINWANLNHGENKEDK